MGIERRKATLTLSATSGFARTTICDVICPPSQSVSSVITTRIPFRSAASAAATPPVPPPITATSQRNSRPAANDNKNDRR